MLITPLDIWLKIVATRLEHSTGESEEMAFAGLAPFQADGARAVIAALGRHGGALLCDSPGLGKTHIALAVAAEQATAGFEPLFVVPAALAGTWRRTAAAVGMRMRWLTHEAVSRGKGPAEAPWAKLIVVDEAHRFRNPLARGYRWLAGLCAGRRVLLVTATPVNNREEDLYHLLRLFAGDASFASAGVPDLREALRPGAGDVSRVLEEVVIRRTRGALQERPDSTSDAFLTFPSRETASIPASPGGGDPGAFSEIVTWLENEAGSSPLLVFLLAKRLASSPHAFLRTVRRVMAGGARRDLDEEGGVQSLLPFFDACSPGDLSVAPLLGSAGRLAAAPDVKALRLRELLLSGDAGERTVVFTEYRDTALALWRSLKDLPRAAMLHGSGGRTACGEASRAEILERFAPVAAGRPGLAPHEELRLLIATDVLSEGLNLQDADGVVSYDLPWNPVRLAQRAGRIDRIGSRHGRIRVLEFPPDPALDAILRLTERLARKSRAIAATSDPSGGPTSGAARALLEGETRRLALGAPRTLARTAKLPDGSVAALRHASASDSCILACYSLSSAGRLEFLVRWPDGRCRVIAATAGLDILAAIRHRPPAILPPLPGEWRASLDACAGRLAVRLESVAGAGGAFHSPTCRRLVALVQRAERASRDDPARLARLERLERRLSAPLDAGTECRIRDLAGSRPALDDLDRLLPLLEAALPGADGPVATGKDATGLRLIGAVLLHSSLVQSITREVSKRSAQSLCER